MDRDRADRIRRVFERLAPWGLLGGVIVAIWIGAAVIALAVLK